MRSVKPLMTGRKLKQWQLPHWRRIRPPKRISLQLRITLPLNTITLKLRMSTIRENMTKLRST